MSEQAFDTAESYVDRGKRQADAAIEAARDYESALEDRISANPLTAVLISLGIGCLVGFLIRGR